jgi:hypothetical protein
VASGSVITFPIRAVGAAFVTSRVRCRVSVSAAFRRRVNGLQDLPNMARLVYCVNASGTVTGNTKGLVAADGSLGGSDLNASPGKDHEMRRATASCGLRSR